jgi:hypothetical protein
MDAASDHWSGIFADEPCGKRNAETGQTKSSHLLSSHLPMNAGREVGGPVAMEASGVGKAVLATYSRGSSFGA